MPTKNSLDMQVAYSDKIPAEEKSSTTMAEEATPSNISANENQLDMQPMQVAYSDKISERSSKMTSSFSAIEKTSNMRSMQVAYGDERIADENLSDAKCCCCDFRKAVMIADGIIIGLYVYQMILVGTQIEAYREDKEMFNFMVIAEGLVVVHTLFHGLGFLGALCFSQCALIFVCVYNFVTVIFAMLTVFNPYYDPLATFGAVLLQGLYFYLHYNFLLLVNKGVMTAANYHRVSKCCCC